MSVPIQRGRHTAEADLEIAAFTTAQVLRLTGLTKRKLEYWIQHGLLKADIDRGKGRGRVRLFSFLNLLEARVAAWLRDKVSLQLIRKIVGHLRTHGLGRPLTEVTFGIVEAVSSTRGCRYEVVMQLPDGSWEGSRHPDQLLMRITVPVDAFASALENGILAERRRQGRIGKVERRRGVLGSAPVIAGTRIPTTSIWELHQAGRSAQQILESYPGIQMADVKSALRDEARRRGRRLRSA